MEERNAEDVAVQSGDQFLIMLSALASPHRLRILASLVGERQYVSQLARDLGMSRPLLILHLNRLQAAGLVTSALELSDDGKAMRYFEIAPFDLRITPERVADVVRSLSGQGETDTGVDEG